MILKKQEECKDSKMMQFIKKPNDSFNKANDGVNPALAPEKLNDILNSIYERKPKIS